MRQLPLIIACALLLLFMSVCPELATSAPPKSTYIVVAKSGGNFTDPVAALNSITDASETRRYLVKIMPGIYNVGTTGLTLPAYVDLEGSGEASEITSQVPPDGSWGSVTAGATLTIVGESTVSRIKITNFAAPAFGAVAILAKGNATISEVVADAQAVQWYSSGSGVEAIGILAIGEADVTVHSARATALVSWSGDCRAIAAYGQGAHVTVHNSTLKAHPAGFGVGLTAEGGGTAEAHGCTIIGEGSNNTFAIAFEGTSAEGSKLIVTDCGSECSAVYWGASARNCEIRGYDDPEHRRSAVWGGRVASSLVDGAIELPWWTSAARLVNCWDVNMNPISNQ